MGSLSKEINWKANVWYIEGLRLPAYRLNQSSSLNSISFVKIRNQQNRRYAKEYMKYQLGVTGQAVSTSMCGVSRPWFLPFGGAAPGFLCVKNNSEGYMK